MLNSQRNSVDYFTTSKPRSQLLNDIIVIESANAIISFLFTVATAAFFALFLLCIWYVLSAAKGRTSVYTTMGFVSVNQNNVFDTNLVVNTLHNQLNTKKIVYCGLHLNCDV